LVLKLHIFYFTLILDFYGYYRNNGYQYTFFLAKTR